MPKVTEGERAKVSVTLTRTQPRITVRDSTDLERLQDKLLELLSYDKPEIQTLPTLLGDSKDYQDEVLVWKEDLEVELAEWYKEIDQTVKEIQFLQALEPIGASSIRR